eukprot:11325124-Heterocapsa_arctica.AAC.1
MAQKLHNKVYIDGSATKIGASAYAGWGMWSPDNPNFKENDALKGKDQGSDRAEVARFIKENIVTCGTEFKTTLENSLALDG